MLSLGSNTKILALASLSLTLLSAAIASARTVVSGSITEDVTWNAAGSPYEVSDTTVVANATITILSGTLVQFLDFSSLHVHGRIVANGSALEKITFTSLSGATEGSPWRVIRLTNDDGSGNGLPASSFTHCVFEGGGNFYHTMLEVSGEAQLSMEECVFRHSVEDGVRFYQDSGGAISNTRFENNAGYGLWLRGSSPAVSDCTFSGNGNIGRLESGGGKGSFPAFTNTTFQNSGHVHIASNIESSGTLTAAPYYLDGHRVALAGASLTIDAGASFRMEDFATWTVHGNVIANGTAAAPILFTSASGINNDSSPWRVIRLTNDDGSGNGLPASSFTHCVFEGGGNFYHTMLEVSGEAQLSMEECVFRHSVEDGVRFYQDSGGAISNTRFENNAGYGLWLRGSSPAVSDCTFSANGNVGRLESGGGKGSFPAFTNTTFQNSGHVHIASNIESSGTLTAAPYYLDGHRVALAGASLTIDAGASFRMEDFATWTVHGNVIANGTAAAPILFTSASGINNDSSPWRVIRLTNDDGSGNGLPASSFTHCVFEGGGNFYHTMLEVSGEAQLGMEQCVFRHSVEDGVRFYQDSGGAVSNTRFENNAGYGLWLRGSSPAVDGCTFSANGNVGRLESGGGKGSFPAFTKTTFQNSGYVHIASNIESSGTLTAAPYYVNDHRVAVADTTITIDAGATFAMADFSTWTVHGNLLANGTENEPILFTSATGLDSGDWRALRLTNNEGNGTGKPNELTYCIFEGGGNFYNTLLEVYGGAPVTLDHCAFRHSIVDGARVYDCPGSAITNCTFEDVAQYGLRLRSISPTVAGNSFQRCGSQAILLQSTATGDSYPVFSNNTFGLDDYIEIGSNLGVGGHLSNPGQAYLIAGTKTIQPSADVSIAPGTTVKFTDFTGLTIQGSLNASGTTAQPITFTSDDQSKEGGQWRALVFGTERTKTSMLKHCVIEGGGNFHATLVEVRGAAQVGIDQCALRTGLGDGIRIYGDSNVPVTFTSISNCSGNGVRVDNASPQISGCTIKDNGGSGVLASGGRLPSISNSFLSGNTAFGVSNQTAIDLHAENNWWGHSSGPYHLTANPDGQGDTVSDHVLFDPYRTTGAVDSYQGWLSDYFTPAEIAEGSLTAADADPDGDGRTNTEEFAFVTNPRSSDAPRIYPKVAGNSFVLEYWRQTTSFSYGIYTSTDLLQWQHALGVTETILETVGETEHVRTTVPIAGGRLLLRVLAENQ